MTEKTARLVVRAYAVTGWSALIALGWYCDPAGMKVMGILAFGASLVVASALAMDREDK